MQSLTLEQWLVHLEKVHPQSIAMGLERVAKVAAALKLNPEFPIITVGGTNGKGSCCAMLEAMLMSAGYRVGCYTSPHLLRYNERVRIAGAAVDDQVFCDAFSAIDAARGDTLLTYFEYGTLAAMLAMMAAKVDVAILEVGLGGRLDAVNIFDSNCAIVASVDLDHMDYLGSNREAIGYEKAGIFRAGKPAICADADPPETVLAHARTIGADLFLIDRDFGLVSEGVQWRYWGPRGSRYGLPHPALRGHFQLGNAAACIAALDELRERLHVTAQDVRNGLLQAEIPGRFQVLPGRPLVILDVAHNPHAARALAANLSSMPKSGKTIAVFSMLGDKDIAGVVSALGSLITAWHVAPVEGPRAASADEIAAKIVNGSVMCHASVAQAWYAACESASEDDKIIVFGSFLTVTAVMRERQKPDRPPRT